MLRERDDFTSIRANPWTGRIRLVYPPGLEEPEIVEILESTVGAAVAAVGRSAPRAMEPADRGNAAARAGVAPHRRSSKWVAPVAVVGGGLGVVLAAHVAHRATELFPARVVRGGLLVWLVTSAALVWSSLSEADDLVKLRRRHAIRELLRFAKPYRRQLVASHVANLASRSATIATLYLIGATVDAVTSPSKTVVLGRGLLARRVTLVQLAMLFGGVIVVGGALEYYSQRVFMRTAHKIAHDIRIKLHAHIQSLEFHELANTNRGVYLTLLNEDINRIVLLFSSYWMVSRELGMSISAMGGFYIHHPGFAGMVITPLPSLILLGRFLEGRIRGRFSTARTLAADLGGELSSALDGIETIRANSRERASSQWISNSSEAYRKQLDSAVDLTALYNPIAASAGHVLRAATGYLIGNYARHQGLSTGTYISLVLMCGMITIPIRGIARDLPHILSTLASLSRVFEAFGLEVEDPDVGETLDDTQVRGAIAFRGVDFSYRPGSRLFEGFTAQIQPGEVTAFVGQTGSGKSTLAKLLLRFHDLDGGLVTLDGRDLSKIRRTDLRRSIAYVGQDIFLFNGSIRQNIAFSEDGIDDELVVEVARTAKAHEFIEQLPQGYDTRVGERGQKLSGGQRQRIGIARALYAPRPIVILDEATSALDSVTEASLHESLTQEFVGRTVIVIAHRLSAIKGADQIHVLDDGELVETGSHEELLRSEGGRYARFWELQTDGDRE